MPKQIKNIFNNGVKIVKLENYVNQVNLSFSNLDEIFMKNTEFLKTNHTKEMLMEMNMEYTLSKPMQTERMIVKQT